MSPRIGLLSNYDENRYIYFDLFVIISMKFEIEKSKKEKNNYEYLKVTS